MFTYHEEVNDTRGLQTEVGEAGGGREREEFQRDRENGEEFDWGLAVLLEF